MHHFCTVSNSAVYVCVCVCLLFFHEGQRLLRPRLREPCVAKVLAGSKRPLLDDDDDDDDDDDRDGDKLFYNTVVCLKDAAAGNGS